MGTLLIILGIIISAATGMAAGYIIFGRKSQKSLTPDAPPIKSEPQPNRPNDVPNESYNADDVNDFTEKLKALEEKNRVLIEDLEDEIDSQNRKLKKEKDNLKKEKESHQNTNQQLERSKQENQSLRSNLELKEQSLQFIQDIINAECTEDNSMNEFYKKLDKLKDFINGEMKETIKNIFGLDEISKLLFDEHLDRWITAQKKTWIKGKTSIAFVGEFSAGKTSIVNRILSMDNPDVPRLPVSTKATTAIPTYISNGTDIFYQFVTPTHELKKLPEATFRILSKEVLAQFSQSAHSKYTKGISSLIQYLVMTCHNPNLDKLSILDTPGFNSNDEEDKKRTIDVINECDALFWVMDVNTGTINQSSIKQIKENLSKPLYIVINKIDTKAPSEVDSVEAHIRKTLNNDGLEAKGFIRFSQKAPLDDIIHPITSIKHNDEDENYIKSLVSGIHACITKQIEEINSSNDEFDALTSELINTDDRINNILVSIGDYLDKLTKSFKSEWHFFGEDTYELSKIDYDEMCESNEKIRKEEFTELKALIENKKENSKKLETIEIKRQNRSMQCIQLSLLTTRLIERIKATGLKLDKTTLDDIDSLRHDIRKLNTSIHNAENPLIISKNPTDNSESKQSNCKKTRKITYRTYQYQNDHVVVKTEKYLE